MYTELKNRCNFVLMDLTACGEAPDCGERNRTTALKCSRRTSRGHTTWTREGGCSAKEVKRHK